MELKIARIKKHLTQEELAKRSGISRNLISKVENGNMEKISYEKMNKIAKVLGVSVKELFFKL